MSATMERISVNGVELEFDSAGSGEAVVFIHGGAVADSFLPLAVEPALRDHCHVIRYRRRGYAGSSPIDGPVSVAEHAQDCRALLGALDVTQAHVVGHSYGAAVALQLAVDAPGVVYSLGLFEPAWFTVSSAPPVLEALGPIMEKYLAGDRIAAAEDLFALEAGPDWRAEVSRTVPGGPEQAINDVATLFESDLPSAQEWRFGAEEAAKIKQPVLFLYGAESLPMFIESRDLFHSWRPHTEDDVMPGANHLLHMRHPADAAARLTDFLKRHAVTA
ncbi:MAG: alpha/beta hydrolase [Actinomycetota bacterium]|nr:alpha/beta hydrolase [Actinomycetota bacterium]